MPFIIEKERDPLYKDGLQKGMEEGIEKASKEIKITIAKAMLKQKMEKAMILQLTGLSKEELKKISIMLKIIGFWWCF